jgi:hypothetical protein
MPYSDEIYEKLEAFLDANDLSICSFVILQEIGGGPTCLKACYLIEQKHRYESITAIPE